MQKKAIILSILILVATTFMSIGFAAINMSLDVGGSVSASAQNDIFIIEPVITNTTNTSNTIEINQIYNTILDSTISVNNVGSSYSITYQVTVYNNTSNDYAFKGIIADNGTYNNSQINYSYNGISLNEVVAHGESKTFTVTLSNSTSSSSTLRSFMNIAFGNNYTITYSHVTAGSGETLPPNIAEGLTYSHTFTNPPSSLTVTMGETSLTEGTGFTYSNGTLTIPNVTGNLAITGVSNGGNGGTWEDPVVDSTTTTYDPEDVPEGTTLYTEIPGEPEVTADEDGNITRFEYTDTGTNGIPVEPGLDTGVLAFDGSDFEVTLKARFTFANCTQSIGPIINITDKTTGVNGVLIYESRSTSGKGHDAAGNNINAPYNKFRFGKYVNSSATGSDDYNIASRVTSNISTGRYGYNASASPLTLTIKLYCINGEFSSEIYDSAGTLLAKPHNDVKFSFNGTGTEFEDITVQLANFTSLNDTHYTHTFDILEFSVQKH